jgi:hypothetical protein
VLFDEKPDGPATGDAPLLGKLVESFGDVGRDAELDLDGVALAFMNVLSWFLLGGHVPSLLGARVVIAEVGAR